MLLVGLELPYRPCAAYDSDRVMVRLGRMALCAVDRDPLRGGCAICPYGARATYAFFTFAHFWPNNVSLATDEALSPERPFPVSFLCFITTVFRDAVRKTMPRAS